MAAVGIVGIPEPNENFGGGGGGDGGVAVGTVGVAVGTGKIVGGSDGGGSRSSPLYGNLEVSQRIEGACCG